MAPRFVFRAIVFGLIACALVLGADLLATDVLKWDWLQDPPREPLHWPPPHLFFHKGVFGLAALGSLAGMAAARSEPPSWPVWIAVAAAYGLATLVGVPIAWLWEGELGVVGWLFLAPLLAVWWTNETLKPEALASAPSRKRDAKPKQP